MICMNKSVCVLFLVMGGCVAVPDGGYGGSSSKSATASSEAGGAEGSDATASDVCLSVGAVCGSGASAKCGVQTDSCGNSTTCVCPDPMTCLYDRCCTSPDLYNYAVEAAMKCSKFPGYSTPLFCGEVPQYAPGSVDAGAPQPWLDKDGVPIEPAGQIPDNCVRAPYPGQPAIYVLWCCTP